MKTICIYHSRDLDGWMSAAIVKHWFYENFVKDTESTNVYDFETKDIYEDVQQHLVMLGWDYGDSIPDLSGYDRIIMCDISFPIEIMVELQNKDFTYIDHHISSIKQLPNGFTAKGLLETNFAACELTWKYFFPNETMPEIVRLLGRYDCFGHKGTHEEQKVLEFQYGARQVISNYEEAYDWLIVTNSTYLQDIHKLGKSIYEYLCTEAKQTYSKSFEIELLEIVGYKEGRDSFKSYTRKFLCLNRERFNPVNFGIDYHKEGYDGFACFWYKDGNWMWSLYNDNGEVDCSAIAKQYGGGGHKGAAGFVCNTETLLTIIK